MYNIPVLQPYRVTQVFGVNADFYKPQYPKWHPWIDFAWPVKWVSQEVYSSRAWTVVQSHNIRGRGNTIVILHPDGMETIYAHLSSRAVDKWKIVKNMEYIGMTGTTGTSTGVHLHFWIRPNKSDPRYDKNNGYDWWVDPTPYFSKTSEAQDKVDQCIKDNGVLFDSINDKVVQTALHAMNNLLLEKRNVL